MTRSRKSVPTPKWTPPLTKAGTPCKRCKKGSLCGSHKEAVSSRAGTFKAPKLARRRGSYKLTQEVLDNIDSIVANSRSYTEIWETLSIDPKTFYEWLDKGKEDVKEGVVTAERWFYESVSEGRRILAQRMKATAVRAAEGVWREEEDKDGNIRYYQQPPDGRLAASIATRLDPTALPPEKQSLEHSGEVEVTTRLLAFDPTAFPKPKEKE